MNYLGMNYPNNNWIFVSTSSNGYSSWTNLVLLSQVLAISPGLVIIDPVNDSTETFKKACCEALIRRVKVAFPNCHIILMKFFVVTDHDIDASVNTPTNEDCFQQWADLAERYSFQLVDFWQAVKDLVAGGAHLNEYLGDTVHPTAAGQTLAFNLLLPHLVSSRQEPAMPARLYPESEYFEETAPDRQKGTDYTAKTGTWTESGTQVSSSEVGATITYTGSFKSFAINRIEAVNAGVQVSIDGGAFEDSINYPPYGRDCAAATTVTFKVTSGTVVIDEVWLI